MSTPTALFQYQTPAQSFFDFHLRAWRDERGRWQGEAAFTPVRPSMGWDSGTVVFRDSCDYGEPSPGQTFIGWFAGNVTSEKIEALNRNTDAGNRGEWNIGEEAIYHVLRRRLHQSSRDPDLPRYELAPHLLLVPFDTHDQFLVEHAQAVASLLDLCGRSTS